MPEMKTLTLNNNTYDIVDDNAIHTPDTAVVGQTIIVKEVDANGKPLTWEATDFPEGGSGEEWELLADVTLEQDVTGYTIDFLQPQKKLRVIVNSLSASADTNYSGFTVSFKNEAGTVYYPNQLIYPTAIPRKAAGISVYDISTYYLDSMPCVDVRTMFQTDARYGAATTTNRFYAENLTERYFGKLMIPEIIRFSQNTYGTFAAGTRYRIYGVRV